MTLKAGKHVFAEKPLCHEGEAGVRLHPSSVAGGAVSALSTNTILRPVAARHLAA